MVRATRCSTLSANSIRALEPAAGFVCANAATSTNTKLLNTEWTHPAVGGTTYPLEVGQAAVTWPDGTPRAAGAFPTKCDNPSWLSNQCYGQTYVQNLWTANGKVAAILLCRHKGTWTDDVKTFDDIAMIIHNAENGNTCWFQAAGDGPKKTANIHCVGCHDNGPWMHSPWINRADVVPRDTFGPYKNPGAAFAGWNTAKSISVADAKLKPSDGQRSCTSCHRISAKLYGGLTTSGDHGNGENQGTWGRWLDWSVGAAFPTKTSDYGQTWAKASWMPLDSKGDLYPATHGLTQMAWTATYGAHVDAVKICAGNGGTGASCKNKSFAMITPTAAPTRAAMTAVLSSGLAMTSEGTLANDWVVNVIQAQLGEVATFSWATDGVTACSVEATLPEAVPYLGSVSTGSNWQTASGSIVLGALNEVGEYAFDINCDGLFSTTGEWVDLPLVGARVVVVVGPDAPDDPDAGVDLDAGAVEDAGGSDAQIGLDAAQVDVDASVGPVDAGDCGDGGARLQRCQVR